MKEVWQVAYISKDRWCPINAVNGTDIIQGSLPPANERWRYFVTTSLIGWAQA